MKQLWVEKYRPDTIKDYVFKDERQKRQIQSWINDQSIPHLLFSGKQGTGKTTLAKVLINELGVLDTDFKYINASRDNGIDYIRDTVTRFATTMAFGDFKVVLLDEADYITPNGQAALRGVMEQYSNSVRFILTCNYQDRIIPAIHSRCQGFHIDSLDKTEFTVRMATILTTEGIKFDIDTLDDYVTGIYPDMRKCIGSLDLNSKSGELEAIGDNDTGQNDYRVDVVALFRNRRYTEARKLICSQIQVDEYNDFYRFMYDNIDFWASPDDGSKVMNVIIAIRNGMVKHPMAGDPEINLSACLCELEILANE